jgi:serine phosphatase RsbU (regulator of sigma subunit)
MIKGLIRKIQKLGVQYETGYVNKKDLVGFNSTFLWTSVLIFLNIFISLSQGLYCIAIVNVAGNIVFVTVLWLNHKGYFRFNRHLGIILANIYVYVMSIVGGEELHFQYAYTIILTVIGIVFSHRRYLAIHLPLCILFFVAVTISYHYIPPIQFIAPSERHLYAFNNGVIFMVLVSVVAFGFRNQTNYYIREIETKKNVIEEKQKEIFDSINYAKRIQTALLNNVTLLDEHLGPKNYFLYLQPKDIVSGDFYWSESVYARYPVSENGFSVKKFDELFFVAVCDSTGHGVPGAFMSIINMGCLKEAVKEKNIYEPGKILDHARSRLIDSISSEEHKDGFDGALLCLNKTTGQLSYASAYNTPLLVRNGQAECLKGDKMPVGKGEKTGCFTTHLVDYAKGDMIYLFTDGFADQFGGVKGKKFMYRRLESLVADNARLEPEQQKQALKKAHHDWKGQLEQVDDICLFGVRLG